jgi:hypothetical protein
MRESLTKDTGVLRLTVGFVLVVTARLRLVVLIRIVDRLVLLTACLRLVVIHIRIVDKLGGVGLVRRGRRFGLVGPACLRLVVNLVPIIPRLVGGLVRTTRARSARAGVLVRIVGVLVNTGTSFVNVSLDIGFWLQAVSIGVAVIGTILVGFGKRSEVKDSHDRYTNEEGIGPAA